MSAPLARLLRLRSLVEETSRLELECRADLAARISRAQQHERRSICESRARALETISEDSCASEQARRRTTEWKNAESAALREQQLLPLALAAARRVVEGREDFIERRKDRRQVESILEAEQTRLRAEQERRAQRDLDDWFGMKQARQSRLQIKVPQS